MTSGMSVKLGDLIQYPNCKTIAVDDMSNAGSLITADAILYAKSIHKPKVILNVGSFAKDVRNAFDDSATPVFTNAKHLWSKFKVSGSQSGDKIWAMPMLEHFHGKIGSCFGADSVNVGNKRGRGCKYQFSLLNCEVFQYNKKNIFYLGKIACFLESFCECDFIHLDTFGAGLINPEDTAFSYLGENLMSGRPTRTIIEFLLQMSGGVENKACGK